MLFFTLSLLTGWVIFQKSNLPPASIGFGGSWNHEGWRGNRVSALDVNLWVDQTALKHVVCYGESERIGRKEMVQGKLY